MMSQLVGLIQPSLPRRSSERRRVQRSPGISYHPRRLGKEMVKKTVKFLALFDHWFVSPSFPLFPSVKTSSSGVLTLQRSNASPYNHSVAFSDDARERVRNANDIVDVIGSYLPLKRAGANFVALCPSHKGKKKHTI